MAPTFKIFIIGMALFLSFSTLGYAQYGQLPYTDQVSPVQAYPIEGCGECAQTYEQYEQYDQYGYGQYDQYEQPASVGSYQYPAPTDPVNELYHRNAQKPLRGLFANGFTRTLTLLGGWNFLNSIEGDGADISDTFSIEPETGYAISFAFGRRHNHRMRSEIELALRENDTSLALGLPTGSDVLGLLPSPNSADDTIRAYSVMKNFIFDFDNASRFTPYVGAGLGWSYLEVDAPSVNADDGTGAFSYQAIGGVATTLNKAADFIVEYRFFGTSEIELDGVSDSFAYNAHDLFMGVKFEY